jgi:putative peptidoglycan lipid II flippase
VTKENSATRSLALSFYTFLSRILGLVRDHYMAITFGTGWVASAFSVAYRFPNMFRNLLAEGTLSQSFMPLYAEAEKVSETEPAIVAGTILTFLTFLLSVFVGLFMVFAPFLIPYLVGGTKEYSDLVIELSIILFVLIMTASLSSIFIAISNSKHKFFVPSLSPIILNLAYLLTFWFFLPNAEDIYNKVKILSFGIICGGVVQLLTQAFYIYKLNLFPRLNFYWKHPSIRKIFSLMLPAVVGGGFYQISLLVDIFLANYIQNQNPGLGAVVSLDYSQRLIQFPTGIIGVALATTILPTLIQALKQSDLHSIQEEIVQVISFTLFLTVPAAIGFFILGVPIIDSLYYGGKWTRESTSSTYEALKFYALAIPMFSMNKVLTSSYYAFKDTKTPLRINMISFTFNISMSLLFMQFFKHAGLALSSAISSTITFSLLIWFFQKHSIKIPFLKILSRIGKLFFPVSIMCLVLFVTQSLFYEQIMHELNVMKVSHANSSRIYIGIGILISGSLYFISCKLFHVAEFDLLFGKLLSKIKK